MNEPRQFPWSPESELLVWCARTHVTEELRTDISSRVQEPLDWGLMLDLAAYHGVFPLLYRNLSTICPSLVHLHLRPQADGRGRARGAGRRVRAARHGLAPGSVTFSGNTKLMPLRSRQVFAGFAAS